MLLGLKIRRCRRVDQEKYERNRLRAFDMKCPHCGGSGYFLGNGGHMNDIDNRVKRYVDMIALEKIRASILKKLEK